MSRTKMRGGERGVVEKLQTKNSPKRKSPFYGEIDKLVQLVVSKGLSLFYEPVKPVVAPVSESKKIPTEIPGPVSKKGTCEIIMQPITFDEVERDFEQLTREEIGGKYPFLHPSLYPPESK